MNLIKLKGREAHEVTILVILVVLAGGYFLVTGLLNKPAAVGPKTQFNTTFDTNTLDEVQQKDNNYPSINTNDIGRTDPYAP